MLYLTLVTLLVGVVSCAVSGYNAYSLTTLLKKLRILRDKDIALDAEYKIIVKYWNDENEINTTVLQNYCDKYISGRRSFKHEVLEAKIFIEKHNLTYQLPRLKDNDFFEVEKHEKSINHTEAECNITIRIAKLNETLKELHSLNKETNAITTTIGGHPIDWSEVRERKKTLVTRIEECIKDVKFIRQYCYENKLDCSHTSLRNDSYYEMIIQNTKDDLQKLENRLLGHVIYHYVQPTVFFIIFVIAFTGNCILLMIFYKNKKFRIPQNMIIFNLALGDSLSLIINVPLYHAYLATGAWYDTRATAQIIMFSRFLCFGLSVFSTVALCLQRYSATLKASNYMGCILRQSTTKSAKMVNVTIWIVACVLAIPHGVHSDIYFFDTFIKKRKLYITTIQVIFTLQLITLGILPFVVISILSWLTVRRFKARAKKIPEDIPQLNRSYQIKILSRSTIITSITPIVFACTWLPYFLFFSLRNFLALDINSLPDVTMNVITSSLLFLGCSFNPIGLYVASGKFRRYMRSTFGLGPRKSSLKYQIKQEQKKALSVEPPTRESEL